MKKVSIVVPCYNEEEALPIFYDEIEKITKKIDAEIEYIFVNDGSRDNTLKILRFLAKKDKRVKYIKCDVTDVDIPISLVTSNTELHNKWTISATGVNGINYRDYISFSTNDGSESGISNIYAIQDPLTGNLENFGDSGKKIRRLYKLKVEIYDYQANAANKFKGEPIVTTNSAFIR